MTTRDSTLFPSILVAALLLAAACSVVTTDRPVSLDPQPLDKEKFEGVWIVDKGTLALQFASNGVGRIAGVEWKDDRFRLVEGEMVVAKGRRDNYMSLRFQEEGAWTNAYHLLQYHFTDQGDLVLWPADAKAFEAAVASNRLAGVVSKGQYSTDVHLTNAPAALIEALDRAEVPTLFGYREPMVFRKIVPPAGAR